MPLRHLLLHTLDGATVRVRALRVPTAAAFVEIRLTLRPDGATVVSEAADEAPSVTDAWRRLAERWAQAAPDEITVHLPIRFERGEARRWLHPPTSRATIWQEGDTPAGLRAEVHPHRASALAAFVRHRDGLLAAGWQARWQPDWDELAAPFRSIHEWEERAEEASLRRYFVVRADGGEIGPELRPGFQVNLQLADQRFGPLCQQSDGRLAFAAPAGLLLTTPSFRPTQWDAPGEPSLAFHEPSDGWARVRSEPWGWRWEHLTLLDDGRCVQVDETLDVRPDRTDVLDEVVAAHAGPPAPALAVAIDPERNRSAPRPAWKIAVLVEQAIAAGLPMDVVAWSGDQVLDALANAYVRYLDADRGELVTANKATLLRTIERVLSTGVDLDRRSGRRDLPVGVTVARALRPRPAKGFVREEVHQAAIATSDRLLAACDLSAPGVLRHLADQEGLAMRCLLAGADPTEALEAGLRLRDLALTQAALERGADPTATLEAPELPDGIPSSPLFARLGDDVRASPWRELLGEVAAKAPPALFAVATGLPTPGVGVEPSDLREQRASELVEARRVARALAEGGAELTGRDTFRAVCRIGDVGLVRQALARGADPDLGVFEAATMGNDEVLEMLLEAGARPEGAWFHAPGGVARQLQLRNPLAAVKTLRGYELLRSRGAALREDVRRHLLRDGHTLEVPLEDDLVRIAARVVEEAGWHGDERVDGRLFRRRGRIDGAGILAAAAALPAPPLPQRS